MLPLALLKLHLGIWEGADNSGTVTKKYVISETKIARFARDLAYTMPGYNVWDKAQPYN